ncbi:MAG: hypothetical protein NTW69_17875, partial [Chloroflexi bacterium]|nr:hypothetical protein [Chloroflexota bacterium]
NVFINIVIVSDYILVLQNSPDFNFPNWNNVGLISRPADLIASYAELRKYHDNPLLPPKPGPMSQVASTGQHRELH